MFGQQQRCLDIVHAYTVEDKVIVLLSRSIKGYEVHPFAIEVFKMAKLYQGRPKNDASYS